MTAVSVHAKKKRNMKTKIIRLSVTVILLCLSMTSCKKKIDENYRPEFIGGWYCDWQPGGTNFNMFSIIVDSNSNAVYQEYGDGKGASISGIARANDNHFKIGRLHHFDIRVYPHQIDTAGNTAPWVPDTHTGQMEKPNWSMTLTAPNFYLGSGTYYKADY
jgi:hypothetical protein